MNTSKLILCLGLLVVWNVDSAENLRFGSFSDLFKLSRFNGTKSITSTIVITKSGVYDYKNVLHVWKGSNWTCSAGKENGPQILRVEASNVTIKNFAYIGDGKTHGSKGLGDPIHITSCGTGMGNTCKNSGPKNVVLDNIFGHACEDMITIGTPGSSNVTIQNSTLIATPSKSAWDKTAQVDFGSSIKFFDNVFVGCKYGLRLKPSTSSEAQGNIFNDCSVGIMMSAKDATITNSKNGPSKAYLKDNVYNGASVKCKDGSSIGNSGEVTCK